MRKESDLAVSDRIRLSVSADVPVLEAVAEHRVWIAEEVLATEIVIGGELHGNTLARQSVDIDGIRADLALTKDE
jgi:hypothetical protein